MRQLSTLGFVVLCWSCSNIIALAAEPPEWAVTECKGLKAMSEVVYYWIDRQYPDGSFGFGLDDDCEFYTSWPILVYAADDQRVLESLRRGMDWVWHSDKVQDGYEVGPNDPEHSAEVTSYTNPLMSIIDYGNPILIERLMQTSKNLERWTAINKGGHRLCKGNWLGSQEMRDYSYFGTDATMVGRAMIPMMHLLWYNRDPDLLKIFSERNRAWVYHAKGTKWGKPYGLLPGEIVFETDEPGGLCKNWWESASSGFSMHLSAWYMARQHEALIINYIVTGDPEFLIPARETLKFYATAKPGNLPEGVKMWPDWYAGRYKLVRGEDPEKKPFIWEIYKRRMSAFLPLWYRMATGDHSFDQWWGKPPTPPTRETALGTGKEVINSAKTAMEVAKTINIKNSVDNYRAKISPGNLPALYHGGNFWVDWPRPACRWQNGNYELGVVLLGHSPTSFKALCCNVGAEQRTFGVQLFELEPGRYRLTLGIDTNGDDQGEKQVREENLMIERGTQISLDLERGHEYLVELQQMAKGPAWTSRADVAVSAGDLFAIPAAPPPGSKATLKIRVHNIGTEDARQVTVWAEELPSKTFIGEQTIDMLARPRDMVPSSVMVEMPWTVGKEAKGVRVVLDGGNLIEELYEGNNMAQIALADMPEGPRIKRKIFIPEWYRLQQKGPVATYTAPYVQDISIDGKLVDPQWAKAERRGPLNDMADKPNEKQTFVRIAYGDDAIYIGVECPEPDMNLLKAVAVKRDTQEVFFGDSVEMFFDPDLDKRTYVQFAFDISNVQTEGQYYNFSIFNEPWESAVHRDKDFWSAEAKIPYRTLGKTARPGAKWGINIYRTVMTFRVPQSAAEREKGWKHSERHALSPPLVPSYHVPERFAEVTFGPKP